MTTDKLMWDLRQIDSVMPCLVYPLTARNWCPSTLDAALEQEGGVPR